MSDIRVGGRTVEGWEDPDDECEEFMRGTGCGGFDSGGDRCDSDRVWVDLGRDVTLNEGGCSRCLTGVGTIRFASGCSTGLLTGDIDPGELLTSLGSEVPNGPESALVSIGLKENISARASSDTGDIVAARLG